MYLRSSKDRSDVSIDAQRRKLETLASERGFSIVGEFADAVESGKDDQRPAFQRMMSELKSKSRAWEAVLLLDTSRLARNVYVAELFKHECRKRDVRVVYANLPESSPVVDLMLVQILQAVDQMHSMMSKEKGLAGMAENVKQGWRAGGRAPWGYKLSVTATGAIRDGAPVTKSKLEPDADLPLVAQYLKARAAGRSRAPLAAELCIDRESSSLIGTEWQALTYAGHTVWNVHNEQLQGGGYKDGTKRKPRSDWVIQRDTHHAAITDDEAEAILAQLESRKQTRTRANDYLLAGILQTPTGLAWHGNAGYYRVGTKNIKAEAVERHVLAELCDAIENNDEFVREVLREAAAMVSQTDDGAEIAAVQKTIRETDTAIERITQALGMTSAVEPLLRRIESLEAERQRHSKTLQAMEDARQARNALQTLDERHVRGMLAEMTANVHTLDRGSLRDWIASVVERIELDPATNIGQIKFRLGVGGVKLASPRRPHLIPSIAVIRAFAVPRTRRGRKAA